MLSHLLLTTGLLGTLLPLSSPAQTAPASSRFYVGVGVNLLSNLPFKDRGIVPRLIGPALTAGVQFTPRLAGQVGLSYHWEKDSYEYIGSSNPSFTAIQRVSYVHVPVLLRYTLTTPAENLHVDILGGATLLHAAGHLTFESNGPIDPALRESRTSDTRVNLTLGPAVRAAISSHLDLTVNGLVSMRVDEVYNFSDRFFLNTSLGLNYKFG
jgi:hypothetical protein